MSLLPTSILFLAHFWFQPQLRPAVPCHFKSFSGDHLPTQAHIFSFPFLSQQSQHAWASSLEVLRMNVSITEEQELEDLQLPVFLQADGSRGTLYVSQEALQNWAPAAHSSDLDNSPNYWFLLLPCLTHCSFLLPAITSPKKGISMWVQVLGSSPLSEELKLSRVPVYSLLLCIFHFYWHNLF